jgi:hypothetical protein
LTTTRVTRGLRAAGLVLAALVVLPGCASKPVLQAGAATPAAPVDLLDAVPFHPQTEFQCGPAALATVLGASGVDIAPRALVPQVYLPERQGSLQVELLGAARRAGRIPYVVDTSPAALWAQLGQGWPVLVLQNLWVRSLPKWHYAVLVGADPARGHVRLNSGDRRGLRMRTSSFIRTWDWAGRWAMVALAPGQLPANPDPARYLLAVADFERVAGPAAAAPAYLAAAREWPADPRPHLALGNHAYAARDLAQAVRHYRAGLRLVPSDAILGNNLASVLGEMGCAAEAHAALAIARKGLAEGGPWAATVEATARELDGVLPKRAVACDALR